MEGEKRTWKFNFLVSILEKMMAFAVADIRAYSALTVKQPLDKIQWTLFRYAGIGFHILDTAATDSVQGSTSQERRS